jgi:hypothetical protein
MYRGVVALAFVVMVACGTDHDPPITWYQTVAPLLAQHCMSCHKPGGIAPFPLTDYRDATENAERMLTAIAIGEMPPFGARVEPDCQPRYKWQHDPRLSSRERWILEQWVARDFPLGTPEPIPDPPRTALDDVSTTLTTNGWTGSGTADQLVCYVLDPGNTEDTWITGLQVRPGASEAVHHVVVQEIPAGPEQDQLVSTAGVGEPFDCNLSASLPNLGIYIWTPGTQPLQMRDGVAVPLPAGAKLALEVHYHPHGSMVTDMTSVDIASSTKRPAKVYGAGLFGNSTSAPALLPDPDDRDPATPEFRIPPDVADHTERMQYTLTTTIPMMIIGPHMHLLGTELEARRLFTTADGDPGEECLFTGTWNFDWQRYYTYDAELDDLPKLNPGDVLDIRCTYNNTLQNRFMSRWLDDAGQAEPQAVTYGSRTVDEMCQVLLGGVRNLPAERDASTALRGLTTMMSAKPTLTAP